ncbi:hypothetical protein Drorol1_Dr00020168 [Drosera rotundifolia]
MTNHTPFTVVMSDHFRASHLPCRRVTLLPVVRSSSPHQKPSAFSPKSLHRFAKGNHRVKHDLVVATGLVEALDGLKLGLCGNEVEDDAWKDVLYSYLGSPSLRIISKAKFTPGGALLSKRAEEEGFGWVDFKAVIRGRFYSESLYAEKRNEFLNLKQGTMIASEYASKFTNLLRFQPAFYAQDAEKQRQFIGGLNYRLRTGLAPQTFVTYQKMYDVVVKLERAMLDQDDNQGQGFKKRKNWVEHTSWWSKLGGCW